MFKIGNITFKNNLVLAPMAGITTSAFRSICKQMGCGLVFSEMISDEGVIRNNKRTHDMLKFSDVERPIAIQIFGFNPKRMAIAAKYVETNFKPDIIDINMGCPVNKVANKKHAGAYLIKDPVVTYNIVKSVVDAVKTPVTVKIRSGWDDKHINAVEIAQAVEKAGASAITIHPRTKEQQYNGKADWNIIKQVKKTVAIPVIGNGDIKNYKDVQRMIRETSCDAVMIGQVAIGNPWFFKECVENKEIIISPIERIEMIKQHWKMVNEMFGEKIAILQIKPHLSRYFKGIVGGKKIVNELLRM